MNFGPNATRAEHLEWCKARALEYCDAAERTADPEARADCVRQAFMSMASDLNKHPATACHPGSELGLLLLMGGEIDTPTTMRDFIRGFR